MTHKGWRVVKPQLNQKKNPLSSLSLSYISSTISSISFLSFSRRWHKMTHKGWRVVKPQLNQKKNPLSSLSLSYISSTISSISFLPFSRRWHKMTQKGWRVVKSQHRLNVSIRTLSSFQNSFTCWRQICDFFFFCFLFFCFLFLFFYFPRKIFFNISCKLFPQKTICMICQKVFSREKRKLFKV